MNDISIVAAGRRDEDVPAEHKEIIKVALGNLVECMNAARTAGFLTEFNCSQDMTGRFYIGRLEMIKKY
jgi:hypothetical protein